VPRAFECAQPFDGHFSDRRVLVGGPQKSPGKPLQLSGHSYDEDDEIDHFSAR